MRPLSKKALLARPKLYFCPKCNTSRSLKPGEEKHYALPRGQGTADVVKYLSCGHPVDVETQESGSTWRQFAGSLSKKAGPDAFGAGISPMSGGGSAGGQGASGGQVNPSLMGPPPASTPTSMKPWRCPIPGCRRVLPSGRELHDHMWDEHEVQDVG